MIFNVTEIDWDTETDDGNAPECCSCHHVCFQKPITVSGLPKILLVELNDRYNAKPPLNISLSNKPEYEDIIEDIIDQLSDTHGWCVNNCTIMRVE